jgi:hypothetical protein
LERWSSDEKNGTWKASLPVFFSEVWPRQKQAKSPSMTAKLCDLAFTNGDVFPLVVDAILPLVTKIDEEGIYFLIYAEKKMGLSQATLKSYWNLCGKCSLKAQQNGRMVLMRFLLKSGKQNLCC